jgi:ribosomal protein L9
MWLYGKAFEIKGVKWGYARNYPQNMNNSLTITGV